MTKAFIKEIAYYLPSQTLDNHQLAELYPEWTPEKIEQKTGIRVRHIAECDETSLDMAEKACRKLFKITDLAPSCIDFIILMTETPDYILPASACVLQHRLDVPETCGAFDINLGCSAYVYGLAVAKGLIVTGVANNILLVTAETYSKLIHPMDKSTRTLFGDAATATWIAKDGNIEIDEFDLGTRGKDAEKLIVPAGMFKLPHSKATEKVIVDENGYSRSQENLYMNGNDVFSFSIDVVPQTIERLLKKIDMYDCDISMYILHQANSFMLSYLRKKLKIEKQRFFEDMSEIGNTVSCSLPIAIKRSMELNVFPHNGNVILCGFGVGLSWGAVSLKVKDKVR